MELTEEAWRSSSLPEMSNEDKLQRASQVVAQRRFEQRIVKAFASLMDELGLALPEQPNLDEYHSDYVGCIAGPYRHGPIGSPVNWIYGLAQHHRTPTRFLDWTTNPLYAAFFAADDRSVEPDKSLAVWAVNRDELPPFAWPTIKKDARWGTVSFPRHKSSFLHAQSGLFTSFNCAGHQFVLDGEWPDMEKTLPPLSLRKLVLPRFEVPELKRLLRAEGVSRAHLMPTMDQISETVYSEWEARLAILSKLTGGLPPNHSDVVQSKP